MKISKSKVYKFLLRCQIEKGGYTGRNIGELAKILHVSVQALRKRITLWRDNDPDFAKFQYKGKQTISLSFDEILLVDRWLIDSPLGNVSDFLRELNSNRKIDGKQEIPSTAFYNFIARRKKTIIGDVPRAFKWLSISGIEVPETYELVNARASLADIFSYSNLKFFKGVDIDAIAQRLNGAQVWFEQNYPNTNPYEWHPRIRPRAKVIRNQLSRIKANESLAVQARLVFEAQVDFIVRLKDIHIDELIHKHGWLQRSMSGKRPATENKLLKEWIERCCEMGDAATTASAEAKDENIAPLIEFIKAGKPDREQALLKLISQYQHDFHSLFEHFQNLTQNFSPEAIVYHHETTRVLLDLCARRRKWDEIDECDRKKLTKVRRVWSDNEPNEYLEAILTKKLITYIHEGKITLRDSFKYQDLGAIIEQEQVELAEDDWLVSYDDLDQLIEGTYPLGITEDLFEFPKNPAAQSTRDEEEPSHSIKIPFQEVRNCVETVVASHNPTWFPAHQAVFEKMTDGVFQMEYDEETFRHHLYDAIGFLGRNLRYSDPPGFYSLQYFIQRFLSDATLDLEFRHLWKVFENLTGRKIQLIIVDTIGINSRRKSLFAKIHGRYHTIGFADLRAVSSYLIPVFSTNCRSTDSEAMNMVEIVNHAKSVLGDDFKFCTGDSHTVSRAAAALSFVAHKVLLLGRNPNPPKKPGPICLSRLRKHLVLLNKIGKLIREDAEYGKIIASRKHIIVNGIDVGNLLKHFGRLVLWNIGHENIEHNDLIQLIETSNRQKRVVRIVERGVTRVTEPNVSLILKSAELILLMAGIANVLDGRLIPKSQGMSPVSMEGVALFVPA